MTPSTHLRSQLRERYVEEIIKLNLYAPNTPITNVFFYARGKGLSRRSPFSQVLMCISFKGSPLYVTWSMSTKMQKNLRRYRRYLAPRDELEEINPYKLFNRDVTIRRSLSTGKPPRGSELVKLLTERVGAKINSARPHEYLDTVYKLFIDVFYSKELAELEPNS